VGPVFLHKIRHVGVGLSTFALGLILTGCGQSIEAVSAENELTKTAEAEETDITIWADRFSVNASAPPETWKTCFDANKLDHLSTYYAAEIRRQMRENKANDFIKFTPKGKPKKLEKTPNGSFSIYDIQQDENVRRAIQTSYLSGNVKFTHLAGGTSSLRPSTLRGDVSYLIRARALTINNLRRLGCIEIKGSDCNANQYNNTYITEGVGLDFLDNESDSTREREFTKISAPPNIGVSKTIDLDDVNLEYYSPRTNAELLRRGVFKTSAIPVGAQCWGGEIFSEPTPYPYSSDSPVYGWYPNPQTCTVNGKFFDDRLYLNGSGFSEEEVFNIATNFTCNRWIEF